MKKIILYFSILVLMFFLISCNENSSSPQEQYSVSGKVLSKGSPIEGAIVKIGDEVDIKTQTDNQGEYKLLNVQKEIMILQ